MIFILIRRDKVANVFTKSSDNKTVISKQPTRYIQYNSKVDFYKSNGNSDQRIVNISTPTTEYDYSRKKLRVLNSKSKSKNAV